MPRKKTSKHRSYSFRRKSGRRSRDKRMPLSVGIGLATSILAPPIDGWTNVKDAIMSGQFDKALQSFVASWTGVQIGGIGGVTKTTVDVTRLINPLDMSYAPGLKTTLVTAIAFRVARKFIGDPLSKIPILKKYLK